MRIRLSMMSAIAATTALVALGAGPASADTQLLKNANQAVSLAEEALPAENAAVPTVPVGTGDEQLVAFANTIELTVPRDPEDPIRLVPPEGSSAALGISLPAESANEDAVVSADGSVVYAASDATSPDVVVNTLATGDVRIQTIINGPEGLHEFTYRFADGVVAADTGDGINLIREVDGVVEVVGSVAAPWAVDAAGNSVATQYRVVAGALVQVVSPEATSAYPIVADPTVSIGWGVYVKFSKSESKSIANSWIADKYKYVSVVCAVIPNPLAATACGLVSWEVATSVHNAFKQARDQGRCTELRYVVLNPSTWLLVEWKPVNC